ncbi:MAG: hypothetical protein IT242_05080 [Bacteroidia bacterium]|nr:hypothetical protein [Bacteroidia bacterium]
MTQEHSGNDEKKSIWFSYFGSGGAAVVAFLWVVIALAWLCWVLIYG